MQMQYRSVLIAFSLFASLAACGDDQSPPSPGADDDSPLRGRWDPQFTVTGFTGHDGRAPTVYDFARDIDGSLLAAGNFEYLGGSRVPPLLRLSAGGAWQPARVDWGTMTVPPSGFSSVAVDATGKLALAGFHDFGVLEARNGEIWVDDGTGLRSIGQFDGLVRKVRWIDGKLWVVGPMRVKTRDGIIGVAVWDGTAWAPPPGGDAEGFGYEIYEDGDELVIAGNFTRIGGIVANSVAAFNGTTWRALDFPETSVYTIQRGPDGELYAGGTFGLTFGATGGLARWNGAGWELTAGGLGNGFNVGVVTDLAVHDGSMFVAGCFSSAGGTREDPAAVLSFDLVRFDGTWHALNESQAVFSPWFEPKACGDEGPEFLWDVSKQAMFSNGEQLLVAGSFPGLSDTPSQALIAYDGESWHPQGPSGRGLWGSLERVAVAPSTGAVWGLGRLTHIEGERVNGRVMKFTDAGWQVIPDEMGRDPFCPVLAVSPSDEVAVGCVESLPNGDPVGRIYRVEGDKLVQRDLALPILLTAEYADDGTLWIGGSRPEGGGFLGKIVGDTYTTIDDTFDAEVGMLDLIGPNDVVVAGSFAQVGGSPARRIARWRNGSWSALGDGLPGLVTAIGHDDTTIYASSFNDGDSGSYLLGAWDGASWRELAVPGSGITIDKDYNFNAIEVVDGMIVAVGSVLLDDKIGRGAVVYRDGQFTAVGGGVYGVTVAGLAVGDNELWFAGAIAEAGSPEARLPSVGLAHYYLLKR